MADVDEISALLDGPRATGAFLLRTVMEPPWSLLIRDEAPLTVVAVVRGEACLVRDDEPVRWLRRGDVALLVGPEPYVVADAPETPVQVEIGPGQECSVEGRPVEDEMEVGVRTWGNSATGGTEILVGTYPTRGVLGGRTLDALPRTVLLPGFGFDSPLLALLSTELGRDEPGQDVVLDRLLDLVVVSALRHWFARPEAERPGWYSAAADPVVGRAVRLLQHRPAEPWTVASLAAAVGVSRAALARRFTELVGEPPMAFLAGWRLSMAADLLRDTDATLEAVARRVGYGSAFALSTAFKRVHGVSPREHRARAS